MHLTYRWQATLVIALGLLMAILDSTIVSVVLPQIARAFNTDFQTITWVGTGYFLASAAVIPIVGYLSDRIGAKTIFLIALALFTLGSGLCAFAPNEQYLISFRILQGIGGGAMLPIAMAIIFRLFGPTERAGAIVILMIPLLLGPAFGPTLGGYLATNYSWNAIFLINLPIGVVAFILSLVVLRDSKAEREVNEEQALPFEPTDAQRRRDSGFAGSHFKAPNFKAAWQGFDFLGLVLSMGAFTTLVYGISEAGSNGWGNASVISFLVTGSVLLIAFMIVELRVKDPVMDVRLFRSYTFTMANILQWATTAVLFGSLFILPLFFESVQGLSSLTTGEILISQGLAMAVGLAIGGRLYNRVGPRILAVSGLVIVAISMIGFIRMDISTTGADLQIWLILRGLGLGLVAQPLQTLAVSVVSNQQMAKATSLISSTKLVFSAVGVAVLTTFLTQQATTHAQQIAAGFLTRPPSAIAAACVQQAGQQAQALKLCVTQHAVTMGLNDTFLFVLIGCVICAVLALFLGRDPAIEAAKAAQKRGETVEKTPVPALSE
jgi:MFS family permease